jgi:ubiquitin carboxyl-terminal hydrolase 14
MAALIKAAMKWGKQKIDVDIDTSASVLVFKNEIFKLTSVPIDRQKLSCPKAWKGSLADDVDLSQCPMKDGLLIMLIGTADVMAEKTTNVVFVEDMKDDEVRLVTDPCR